MVCTVGNKKNKENETIKGNTNKYGAISGLYKTYLNLPKNELLGDFTFPISLFTP